MITGSISRRYAKALLGIGVESGQYEALGSQLEQFAQLLQNDELREVLSNPIYPLAKRKAVLETLIDRLKPSETVGNLLRLLVDRNRAGFVPDIAREYRKMADEQAGRIRVDVTSAQPLAPDERQKLVGALTKYSGKTVLLTEDTDAELIAGIVTQIGSVIFDGSIRTQLAEMKQTLLENRQ